MIRAIGRPVGGAVLGFGGRLGYPLASVVVGTAWDQDDRDTTGRDEDRAR